jgi:hypothetical protein
VPERGEAFEEGGEFTQSIAGTEHTLALFQHPGTSTAELIAQTYRGVARPTVFNGSPAWIIRSTTDPTWTYLVGSDHDSAAMLGAANISDDDLQMAARTLVQTPLASWSTTVKPATTTETVSPVTTAVMVAADTPAGCQRSLHVVPTTG